MSLTTPESVWNLQKSLQTKAKANPALRFSSLYDKIYRRDVLTFAWQRCRANGGSAGSDGQTFEQIESGGLGTWLDGLTEQKPIGPWTATPDIGSVNGYAASTRRQDRARDHIPTSICIRPSA